MSRPFSLWSEYHIDAVYPGMAFSRKRHFASVLSRRSTLNWTDAADPAGSGRQGYGHCAARQLGIRPSLRQTLIAFAQTHHQDETAAETVRRTLDRRSAPLAIPSASSTRRRRWQRPAGARC